ncbi:MAG: ABC transporter substrate-binding protein [Candidatus Shapirobacteria bacterium]|jgi:peptide/nickel transport system substrate-binding protein
MITKLRFKFELSFYYLKRNWPYLLSGLILGIILVIFRQNIFDLYHKISRKTDKIGINALYTLNNLPSNITNQISYGLTQSTSNGKFEISPLVKNLDIRQNNTQYLFELNSNFYWHNGHKFTASDVNYQIPGLKITVTDSTHLSIQTDKAFAPILSTLSQPLIQKNFNSLGKYKVTRYDYQDGYLKDLYLKSSEKSIIYRFYQSEDDLLSAFKIGEINQMELTSIPNNFNQWPNTSISKDIQSDQKYLAIFLNTNKISNKQLRQALAYATPKTTDMNERALSPISPSSWAYNPDVKDYAFNPTKAKDFFAKNKIDTISLTYNDRRLLNLAEDIQKNWQEILGIKVNLNISNQIDTQNFDAILAYGSIPADPDQYLFWHSTQNDTNLTKLNNPIIDKLLEEGRQSFDQQERKKIYQEFQKTLLEECPAIFLKYPIVYTVIRN